MIVSSRIRIIIYKLNEQDNLMQFTAFSSLSEYHIDYSLSLSLSLSLYLSLSLSRTTINTLSPSLSVFLTHLCTLSLRIYVSVIKTEHHISRMYIYIHLYSFLSPCISLTHIDTHTLYICLSYILFLRLYSLPLSLSLYH